MLLLEKQADADVADKVSTVFVKCCDIRLFSGSEIEMLLIITYFPEPNVRLQITLNQMSCQGNLQ
jgi:hypothetical protein